MHYRIEDTKEVALDERQLQAVLRISELESITKAAESLHISPQGLSNQLDAIERELSCSLFFRTRKGCFPTPAGKEFCHRAPALIEHLSSFADAVKSAEDDHLSLRIALWRNRGNHIEDAIAHTYRQKHPDVFIKYVPVSEKGIVSDIAEGLIDVAYCAEDALPINNSRVESTLFEDFQMGFNCFLSDDNPLVRQSDSAIEPKMLKGHKIAMISPFDVENLSGVSIDAVFDADKYEIVEKCFDGWVCIADSFFELQYPGVTSIPLDVSPAHIAVLHRTQASSVVSLFLGVVEDEVTQHMHA